MKKIEDTNTLVFIVDLTANKRQIKDAVKRLYEIKAERVNTLVRCDTLKRDGCLNFELTLCLKTRRHQEGLRQAVRG